MAARLTDGQKKKIVADYIQTGNVSEAARMNNVSRDTVKRLYESDEENANKLQEKKDENTQTVLEYLDANRDRAIKIIDMYSSELLDESRLKVTSSRDIATIIGIFIDKYTRDGINKTDKESEMNVVFSEEINNYAE